MAFDTNDVVIGVFRKGLLWLGLLGLMTAQSNAQELVELGDFGVGYERFNVTDSIRDREFHLDVWYPSKDTPMEGAFAVYKPLPIHEFGFPSQIAGTNSPIANGPFPLIINSHGGGTWSGQDTDINEILASHGFVVAAIEHIGETVQGYTLSFAASALERR